MYPQTKVSVTIFLEIGLVVFEFIHKKHKYLPAHDFPLTYLYILTLNIYDIISGIKVTEYTPENLTLEQLGFDVYRANEVAKYLDENFCLTLESESVPKLTISR